MSELNPTLPDGKQSEGRPFGMPSPLPMPVPAPAASAQKPLEEQIAELRGLIAEKDHAVIRSVVATSELQQQLDTAQAESAGLRAQLETLAQLQAGKDKSAIDAEVAKITAQYKLAQKTVERNQSQLRTELLSLKARWQQSQQQLESERKARQVESAAAARKIASLERNLADVTEKTAEAQPKGHKVRYTLAAAAITVAALIVLFVVWPRIPKAAASAAKPAAATKAADPRPIARIPYSTLPPREFQGALGRLNDALANFPGRNPEDVLAEVRQATRDPTVCAFRWNAGQPAIEFSGKSNGISLASSVARCAQAVEKALRQ